MRGSGAFRTSVAPGGALAGPWVRNPLWRNARTVPSLDLQFADNKSLVDAVTNQNLVTFTRVQATSNGSTYVGSDGLIKTAGTNEPRFDHNPTTGESLGLLVEEARTNSIRNNTMVGAVAGTPGTDPTNWIVIAPGNGITKELVGTGVENGIAYIDYRYFGTPTATGIFNIQPESVTLAAAANGQTWTSSYYIKLVNGSLANTSLQHWIAGRTIGGSFITNQWSIVTIAPTTASLITQRFAATYTVTDAAVAFASTFLRLFYTSGLAIDFTLRIGLPQLEQGAFATSAIPTTTATVTRAADVASITESNFSSWYNQTEGTVFAAFRDLGVGGTRSPYFLSDGSVNNRIGLFNNITTTVNNRVVSGGAATNPGALSLAASTLNKHAIAVKRETNGAIAACNGTLSTAASPASAPVVTQLAIGSFAGTQDYNNAPIARLTYWPTRLANTTLQQITQP